MSVHFRAGIFSLSESVAHSVSMKSLLKNKLYDWLTMNVS